MPVATHTIYLLVITSGSWTIRAGRISSGAGGYSSRITAQPYPLIWKWRREATNPINPKSQTKPTGSSFLISWRKKWGWLSWVLLLLLWCLSCIRRIKLVRGQHLSEKATPVAEKVCVVHQHWIWVRRGGFVCLSTSRHLWPLCKANEFAVGQGKDTSYQGKEQAAFAHLDLKQH